MNKTVKVIIGGDVCIQPHFLTKELFLPDVIALFLASDLNIVNLECPITSGTVNEKRIKTGPRLYSQAMIIDQLKKISVNVVTLANNHILDSGKQALLNTLKLCHENEILTVGAGENQQEASKPLLIEKDGNKIAIINFCENEWSISLDDMPGANPLNIIENVRAIEYAKKQSDFVILIIHTGHELYNLPSPRTVKLLRFFVECGANTIICHHSHCFSGYEVYKNVPIFYGTGNLLFTRPSKSDLWYTGVAVQLDIQQDKLIKWKLIPLVNSKKEGTLNIGGEWIENEIERLTKIIQDPVALKKNWKLFLEERKEYYLQNLSVFNVFSNRYFRYVIRKLKIYRYTFSRRYLSYLLNFMRCESHNDALSDILFQVINNNEKCE